MNQLIETEWAYIAGFLDGDGSIMTEIVKRNDYRLKFEIRYIVTFTQKTSRNYSLIQLRDELGIGNFRNRGDGCSELAISGWQSVKPLLEKLEPYLKIKKKQANLILQIIEKKPLVGNSPLRFLESCELCDKIALLNDSRTRMITSNVVRDKFLELKFLE